MFIDSTTNEISMLRLVKSLTVKDVGLPYSIIVSFGDDKELRKQLVSRYLQGDFSCQVERYTSIATINFRNEMDAADFLMRL
jgi:hypothetical protein